MANLDFNDDLRRAMPLRLERHLNGDRFLAFVSWLAGQLYQPEEIVSLRPGSQQQLLRTVSCIVANVSHAALEIDQACFVSIALRDPTFRQSRYNTTRLGYDRFRDVVQRMQAPPNPWIGYWRGGQDRLRGERWTTKLRATERLLRLFSGYTVRIRDGELRAAAGFNAAMRDIDAAPMVPDFRLSRTDIIDDITEVIVLKDVEIGRGGRRRKIRIPYAENDATREMRRRLDSWNNFSAENFHLDIIISDDHLRNMFVDQQIQNAKAERPNIENDEADEEQEEEFFNHNQRKNHFLDLSRTKLHRVFNNGSFEEGGRFYGAWWISVPKRFRPYITINNVPTTEYDFSTLHPAMLYAEAGVPLPEVTLPPSFIQRRVESGGC